MGNHTGIQLGNYRLIQQSSQDNNADIYTGEHISQKTRAAVKILKMQSDPETLQSFLNEVYRITHLDHPNIVPILEFGMEKDNPFVVMGYTPYYTLRECHPVGSRLAPQTIIAYIKQAAAALQYAHAQKILHRDIKPENMLLGENKTLLVSDFGLAMLAHTIYSTHTHNVSKFRGRADATAYMAPEQFDGQACEASDQYALGIVAYEWFCGTRPFTGSDLQVAVRHMYTQPPSLKRRVPALEPAIEDVIIKALAKKPEERFANVQAFADALESACQEAPSSPYALADSSAPSLATDPLRGIDNIAPLSYVTRPLPIIDALPPSLMSLIPLTPLIPEQHSPILNNLTRSTSSEHIPPSTTFSFIEADKQPQVVVTPLQVQIDQQIPPVLHYNSLPLKLAGAEYTTRPRRRWPAFLSTLIYLVIMICLLLLPLFLPAFSRQPDKLTQITKSITPITSTTQTPQPGSTPPPPGTPSPQTNQQPVTSPTSLVPSPVRTPVATSVTTTTPTPVATSTPTPTPTSVATATPTQIPVSPTCQVSYVVRDQWPGGFTTDVSITNRGSTTINGWTLRFTFPGSQQVTQGWNGSFSQQGQQVTISNLSYNSSLSTNGSTPLGFNGSWSGDNQQPTSFTLNGAACSVS